MMLSEIRNGQPVRRDPGKVTFEREYDVIVSGVGTAGSLAVIMAAQNGLRVLGIEALSCLGGTAVSGGVQGAYFPTPGGRFMAMDEAVDQYRDAHTRSRLDSRKIVLEQMALESGGELLYESSVCGVYLEENTVIGVRVITPEGLVNFRSRVLMDCTGDVYTAHMAGCETEFGRKLDGLTQPYSMVSCMRTGGVAVRTTNVDFGRLDQRDDRALSEALIFSRAYEMDEERKGNRFLYHMPLIGTREGRRIIPAETVRVEDIFVGKTTAEPMFYGYADLDKHGWDIAFDGEALGDWAIGANLGAYNITIPVPWKAIIPKDLDGILVPCRGLGVDRDVSSCVRMVTDMKRVAEAAADMALLAIENGCKLREIPYEQLKKRLTASGCLNRKYTCDVRVDGTRNIDGSPMISRDVHFITDPARLEEKLATDTPGEAIWSARLMGGRAKDTLRGLLASGDGNTRKHAAFALAITGDDSGIEILREMAAERDGLMLRDCRKHNQQRGCMAIYFLGRLGDAQILDTLIEIITDEQELTRPAYHQEFAMGTRYEIGDFNNSYFQFVSNAVVAMIRIGDAHPDLRQKIAAAFRTAFEDECYCRRITTRPKMSSEGGMAANIKQVAYGAVNRWMGEL